MSQHDYVIDNAAGGVVRADINAALAAIASQNAGTGAPSPTYAHMVWPDTAANLVKWRNSANTAWVVIASWDGTTYIPYRAGVALGNAAILTAGTAANNLLQLDVNGHLPALDMRNLVGQKFDLAEQTGTAYTLTESDRGKVIRLNNESAITLTLPQVSTEDLIVGFQCICVQWGAGQITFAPQGADVVRSLDASLTTVGRYAAVSVAKIADGEYWLAGGLT